MAERGISGQVVAITGGARGIGETTARKLADHGARIAIGDLDGDLSRTVADGIGQGAGGYELDVTDRGSFEAFLDRLEAELGPLDTLVNNAGIAPTSPRVVDQTPAVISKTIEVNLNGVINGTLSAVKRMEPRGSGQVVNIASLAGVGGVQGLAAYSASKFGVVGFTESIRLEMFHSGIIFTCVMPGPVETEMMAGTSSSPMIKLIPQEEVAEAVIGAMKTGKTKVAVPKSVGVLARILSLLPSGASYRFNNLIGMDRVYTQVDPAARATYRERTTGDLED